ncbi:MAG TPA: 50S ribosomal protein L15 [Candidatus Babeliales bacterium]|nr:50S ribosomal protein L15 [Candidatus Babeliales bacterium]
MFQLDKLTPIVKKRKRVGRGGKLGGTSTRGSKGQKARSGGAPARGYEGGQMPLARRMPKRGFNNTQFAKDVEIVSLDSLNEHFNDGDQVTIEILHSKSIIKNIKSRPAVQIKILGDGKLTKKLIITADAFSKSAIEAIKNAGGEARLTRD